MAKPIIAIAVDIFCPGAYRAPEWPTEMGHQPDFIEDYSHEKDFAYVVLQPLLFRAKGDGVDEFPVAMTSDPSTYFSLGRVLSPTDVEFANRDMCQKMPQSMDAIPVSLPPGTKIQFDLLRGDEKVWSSNERVIGQTGSGPVPTSPFLLMHHGWPAIASVNFAHPLANSFAELDEGQQEEVYVWLGAAVVDLLRNKREPNGKPLTKAQEKSLTEFGLRDSESPPPTYEEMRARLVNDQRGEKMYDLLLHDKEQQVRQPSLPLSAPRYKILKADLFETRILYEIGETMPPGHNQASYLHVWWHTMCNESQKNNVKAAWGNPAAVSELAGALGRYFGFGERLRWPLPEFNVSSSANEVFMVPKSQTSGGCFETNAASLCELVFRVPIAKLKGDASSLKANLSVAGRVWNDEDNQEERRLAPQLVRVAALALQWHNSCTCHAVVQRDERDETGMPIQDANGIVMVQPRAAQCVDVANPKVLDLFSVPSLLLDLADSSPRHRLSDGEDGLVAEREQRRALFPEECLAFDEALLGATLWRIEGELRAAAVVTILKTPPRPRVYEFLAARLSHMPVQGVASGIAETEASRFKEILPELLASNGRYQCSLWLPNGAGVFPMAAGQLLDADGPDSDLRFYVLDEDPENGIGKALPDTSGTGRSAFPADLVIEVVPYYQVPDQVKAARQFLPFNIVRKSGAAAPWVALKRSALSRVSRSVDRWMERFHVIPIVEGDTPTEDNTLNKHLLNFNKLRVFARGETDDLVPITYPDAAVPLKPVLAGPYVASLPWENGFPTQPPFSYFVGHLYSQENKTERPSVGNPDQSQDRKPERLRFVRYRRACAREVITGYLEHQYSYRIPIIQPEFVVDARLATDLRNPATLVARDKGTQEQEGRMSPLLEVRIADNANELLIAGRNDYFRYAFATETKAKQMQGSDGTLHMDTLRGIYEAVRDFMHALEAEGVWLHVHLYRFDNSLPRQYVVHGGNQALPARLHRFKTGQIQLQASVGIGAQLRVGFEALAPLTFEKFKAKVMDLLSSGDADLFAPVRMDMENPAWRWWEGDQPSAAPNLHLDANVVRVALDLYRPPELVVDPAAADGRFIPFTAATDAVIPSWIKENIGEVVHHAKDELRLLLRRPGKKDEGTEEEGSSLYFRRDWLYAKPPEGSVIVEPAVPADAACEERKAKMESREGRWRMIFGDYAATVLVPPGSMRNISRVIELFYVPVAFRPIAAHPTLVTANDSLDFAEFLLHLAGDLLEGRQPDSILLKSSATGAASDGVKARLRLQELLEKDGGIAGTLQQLVHVVHNDADLRGLPDSLVKRALVVWDQAEANRNAALRALLAKTPQVFATARAIGVILFDRERFDRALQSIQLCKCISQTDVRTGEGAIDVDRFVIPPVAVEAVPVLLDPLEAGRYDSEFELPMNTYQSGHGQDLGDNIYERPIELNANVTLTSRGGASGRTGEDFIESAHHFPPPEDTSLVRRAVEVDAPHWNPRWSYAMKVGGGAPEVVRRLYLLPSRRFPATPVALQVTAATSAAGGKHPVPVNISAINLDLKLQIGNKPKDYFLHALRNSLEEMNQQQLVIRTEDNVIQNASMWTFVSSSTANLNYTCDEDWRRLGWYRIDTFLEHHYFLVEAGEEGRDNRFANELFEIEVQVNRKETQTQQFEQFKQSAVSELPKESPLLLAFRRWQQKRGQISVGTSPALHEPKQKEAMTLPELVESIGYWLCESVADPLKVPLQEQVARGKNALLPSEKKDSEERPQQNETMVHFLAQYECADPEPTLTMKLTTKQQDVHPLSERVGSVVTVSMYKQELAPSIRGERAIVRVSVLADPWSRLSVRMRQVRNRRDVDGGKPDIDPVFEMPSAYSSWSGYAHQEMLLDPKGFDDAQAPLRERRLDVTNITLRKWLQTRFSKPAPDIGKIVQTRVTAVIPSGPYIGQQYWNSSEMLHPERKVSMVLRQRQPDRHMIHDGVKWKPLCARDLRVPRHIFGVIASDQIDNKLRAVAPNTVTAGESELEIAWLDKSSGGPVYRVIWPIRFRYKE